MKLILKVCQSYEVIPTSTSQDTHDISLVTSSVTNQKHFFEHFLPEGEFLVIFFGKNLVAPSHTPLLSYPLFSEPKKEVQKMTIFPLHPVLYIKHPSRKTPVIL